MPRREPIGPKRTFARTATCASCQAGEREAYRAPLRRIGEGLYWAERDSALDGAHPVSIPESKDRHDEQVDEQPADEGDHRGHVEDAAAAGRHLIDGED